MDKESKELTYEELKESLTAKRQKFCEQYLLTGYNCTQAAINAGFSSDTAYSYGSELLKKPEIKMFIQKLREHTGEVVGVSLELIASEWKNLAFSNIADIFDIKNNSIYLKEGVEKLSDLPKAVQMQISSIKPNRHGLEVKMYSRDNAMKQLSDLLGYKPAEKVEIGQSQQPVIVKLND